MAPPPRNEVRGPLRLIFQNTDGFKMACIIMYDVIICQKFLHLKFIRLAKLKGVGRKFWDGEGQRKKTSKKIPQNSTILPLPGGNGKKIEK